MKCLYSQAHEMVIEKNWCAKNRIHMSVALGDIDDGIHLSRNNLYISINSVFLIKIIRH